MLSDGYWIAVGTSDNLNLGWGSSSVMSDSESDPADQRQWFIMIYLFIFGGVYLLNFQYKNLQDLLRNAERLSHWVQPRQRWNVVRGLAHAAQQSCHIQSQQAFISLFSLFSFAISSWQSDSVNTWQKMTSNPHFCARFWLRKAPVLNFRSALEFKCNSL